MDLNKYDRLVQETCYVKNKLIEENRKFGGDPNTGIEAAILVASENNDNSLGKLAGCIPYH